METRQDADEEEEVEGGASSATPRPPPAVPLTAEERLRLDDSFIVCDCSTYAHNGKMCCHIFLVAHYLDIIDLYDIQGEHGEFRSTPGRKRGSGLGVKKPMPFGRETKTKRRRQPSPAGAAGGDQL